ncbi:hypothetical protein [Bradyrhizobium daqingense]|uniref:hypothetical protein n=1 Tax=Bradyrhizobium daqingense TaxID=993502 RepID=UPI0038364D54
MLDQNNGYEFAGEGAKRRRQRLEAKARQNKSEPSEQQRKATSKRAPKFRDVSGSEARKRIRLLALRSFTFQDVSDAIKREGYRVSGIAISGVRSDMRAAIKLLIDEGLLDEQRLKQYRRKHSR